MKIVNRSERICEVGENENDEIVVNFDLHEPEAHHVVFSAQQAIDFAETMLRRAHQLRDRLKEGVEAERDS